MKNHAMILLAAAFFWFGLAAQAEIQPEVSVTVPFNFVANGKTLPAGTYKVGRLSGNRLGSQLFINRDKSVAVFVNPVESETTYADKPVVRFKQVGNRFFLSAIQTDDRLFNFRLSRTAKSEAAPKSTN